MIQDPVKRSRVKSTLLIVILATIPCYLLGMIVLWVSNGVRDRATPTPTVMATEVITEQPTTGNATLPVPTAMFPTATNTQTPTITLTPTLTRTYVVPTSTPSKTPTATLADTATPVPLPSDTPTLGIPIATETLEIAPTTAP